MATGSDALPTPVKPRSRKSSMDHAATPSNNGPTTFFMRSEHDMEQSLSASQSTQSIRRQRDSTYGVQSLADTLEAAFGAETTTAGKKATYKRNDAGSHTKHTARSGSHSSSVEFVKSPESPVASPLRKLKRKLSSRTTSAPLTPLNVEAPSPLPISALPSTPTSVSLHSLKLSDEGSVIDETGSQVITSSGEEEDDGETQQGASMSFPQLVMPSIQMPTRRPFTIKGKNMGKLKVLVAGQADTPGYLAGSSEQDDMSLVVEYLESLLQQTASITNLEDGELVGVISGSGGILVDVVLYMLPPNKDITKDIEFMQRLSTYTNVIPVIAKSETLTAPELVSVKASVLARLQSTAIKPFLFGKPIDDALLAVQGLDIVYPLETPRTAIHLDEAKEANQFPFPTPTHPYAVSSVQGSDADVMEASLLMSPDYVQPLVPSELSNLIEQVFDPESIAWLRHAGAKKFLSWRRRTKLPGDSFILHGLQQPRSPTTASVGLAGTMGNPSATSSVFSAASPSGVLVPRSISPFYSNVQSPLLSSIAGSPTDPTAFSLTHYINNNPQASDIRVAKWATDLHKSLRNERDRFEDLQRNERAKWLLERVGEEVKNGTIVTADGPRAEWAIVRHGNDEKMGDGQRYGSGLDSKDPLGLCGLSDELKKRGFVLCQVVGGMSLLGAVGLAIIRVAGWETPEGGVWGWFFGGVE
ncbi:hypothetical protein SLS61_000708 [Didymella pomorum]